MALSAIGFLRREARPTDAVLVRIPGRLGYHDHARHLDAAGDDGVLVYRFDAPLFYANAERFRSRLRALADEHGARAIVVDAAGITTVDVTAVRTLGELLEGFHEEGVAFALADPTGHVKDALSAAELPARRGEGLVFDTVDEAVEALRQRRAWPLDPGSGGGSPERG
jgi:sulfate permease, SulP family